MLDSPGVPGDDVDGSKVHSIRSAACGATNAVGRFRSWALSRVRRPARARAPSALPRGRCPPTGTNLQVGRVPPSDQTRERKTRGFAEADAVFEGVSPDRLVQIRRDEAVHGALVARHDRGSPS